jgi:hypothetical protein
LLGLQGTKRTIREYAPALAVCAYRLQDLLWKVPLLIHSLWDDYRLYLRPYGQIWEAVCYAAPAARQANPQPCF